LQLIFSQNLEKIRHGYQFVENLKKKFLSKEDIWEPICIELEKKSLEQRRDGYPFAENLKKKSHHKSNQWVQHTSYKSQARSVIGKRIA